MSDRNRLRHRLEKKLPTDADLNACCLDFLPEVKQRFTDGMDRIQKLNLILETVDPVQIASALDRYKAGPTPTPPPSASRVSIGRLPTSIANPVGRIDERQRLQQAWDGPARRHVVSVVALGGQGKSTLVTSWLVGLAAADFRGAARVFAWSFYSQGASDDRAASADEFIAAALTFFGDPDPTRGTPFDKADRLRDLIRQGRTLLVLDGLEPLQHPPGAPQGEGTLKDQPLASLLRDLAVQNPGLVVISSRIGLADLQAYEGSLTETIKLDPLSDPEGTQLLRSLSVRGSDEELAAAVRDFAGHPLALTLVGSLLRDAFDGDVAKRSEVGPLQHEDQRGGHARRAMAAYDRWFGPGPQRAVLRLLGLFDRPALDEALAALRAEPAVPGLNEPLVTLSPRDWSRVIARLRRAGLIAPADETSTARIDTHPLIREHFGQRLHTENEAAWQEGHARLYAWYAGSTKDRPDTADEMAPLYAAVFHGCRAGRHQEVLDEVFSRRIRRGNEAYSVKKLGSFGADLSALSGFFSTPWTKPVPGLRESDQAFVLNEAGYALRAQGRLEEAVAPMRAGLEARRAQQNWGNAARVAGNLSGLQLGLGRVREATSLARQAVELADRSHDAFLRLAWRTTLADALHQGGQMEEARRLFVEAEAMQQERQPEWPFLYSMRGYRYCDLLLDQGASEQVLQRAARALDVARQNNLLLDIGLDHLSLGRAHAARLAAGQRTSAAPARDHLNQAVTRLRESGDQQYLPLGLLHRAAWFRQTRDYASAARDLDEGLLLAKRGHMRLHECDFHLERARLLYAQKKLREARYELRLAKELVDQTGYERRRAEVERLMRELAER
jgi:tetratricopeptide (TPR) repeat protein